MILRLIDFALAALQLLMFKVYGNFGKFDSRNQLTTFPEEPRHRWLTKSLIYIYLFRSKSLPLLLSVIQANIFDLYPVPQRILKIFRVKVLCGVKDAPVFSVCIFVNSHK